MTAVLVFAKEPVAGRAKTAGEASVVEEAYLCGAASMRASERDGRRFKCSAAPVPR